MPPLSTDWKITVVTTVVLFSFWPLFKVISWRFLSRKTDRRSLFFRVAPVFSIGAIQRSRLATPLEIRKTIRRGLFYGALQVFAYFIYGKINDQWSPSSVSSSYLAVPIVYLWGEIMGPLVELMLHRTGRLPAPTHRNPLFAVSVTDFWSRWNTWVRDFFFTSVVWPLRRKPILAVMVAFFASGLMHEIIVNFPFWLVTNRNLFGSQIGYFGIQGFGLIMDHKYLSNLIVKWTWLVVIVLLPAPLIINEALLRGLHLLTSP